ncbi:MAG: substrate-binding domain-containing protein [Thermodesulfobacteriota bacterium]|nr:substrate-binding domain-containing protein [Thermodesulfobacteriota bacterium]
MKKILSTMVAAAAMFAMVGVASAAPDACDCSINLYGASAQYKFWTDAADNYLINRGCAPADTYLADGDPLGDRDNGIAICAGSTGVGVGGTVTGSGMPGVGGGGTMCLRYTSYASFEGIYSVSDANPLSVDSTYCDSVTGSQNGDLTPGCVTPDTGYRMLADEMQSTFALAPAVGTVSALACRDIHIGASDVEAAAFQQQSSGQLQGPCMGGAYSASVYNVDSYLCPGYRFHKPLIVPFTFFKNDDCANTTPVPFDDMTDIMAAAIFSGAVNDWNDFDPSLPSKRIKACMRHAGSGTHATLYASILFHQSANLIQSEMDNTHPLVGMGLAPEAYFNKGSSDMMYCVGGRCKNAAVRTTEPTSYGAVGYADVDKFTGAANCTLGKYGYVQRMLFNGQGCVTGACDNSHTGSGTGLHARSDTVATYKDIVKYGRNHFWADQHLYSCPHDFNPGIDSSCYPQCGSTDWIADLAAFASVPGNLPASKAPYWATQGEMKVKRANAFAPIKF